MLDGPSRLGVIGDAATRRDDAVVGNVLPGRDSAAEEPRGRDGAQRGHLQGGDQGEGLQQLIMNRDGHLI